MPALAPSRYQAATAGGLLTATAALGLGIERLVRGAPVLGGALVAAGVALSVVVLSLRIEGDPGRRTLLLLTREACPHCDEARAILGHLQDELAFDLWEVDITDDPELVDAYGTDVPVVLLDEQVIATLEVREAEIRQVLGGPPSEGSPARTA